MRGRLLGTGIVAALAGLALAGPAPAAVGPNVQASGLSPFAPGCHGRRRTARCTSIRRSSRGSTSTPPRPTTWSASTSRTASRTGARAARGRRSPSTGAPAWEPLPLASAPEVLALRGRRAGKRGRLRAGHRPVGELRPGRRRLPDHARVQRHAQPRQRHPGQRVQGRRPHLEHADRDPARTRTNNVFNDKESITADWTDADYVYAIWDRLVFPNERSQGGSRSSRPRRSAARPGSPARTDGGATWEPARPIFDPGQNDQTIGNQIVVMPDGDLVNVMTVFRNDNGQRPQGRLRLASCARRTRAPRGRARSRCRGSAPSRSATPRPGPGADRRHHPRDRFRRAPGHGQRLRRLAGRPLHRLRARPDRLLEVDRRRPDMVRSRCGSTTGASTRRRSPRRSGWTTRATSASSTTTSATTTSATRELETDVWMVRSTDGGATWREERVTPISRSTCAPRRSRGGFFTGDYIGLTASGTTCSSRSGRRRRTTRTAPTRSAQPPSEPFGGELIVPDGAPAGQSGEGLPGSAG